MSSAEPDLCAIGEHWQATHGQQEEQSLCCSLFRAPTARDYSGKIVIIKKANQLKIGWIVAIAKVVREQSKQVTLSVTAKNEVKYEQFEFTLASE